MELINKPISSIVNDLNLNGYSLVQAEEKNNEDILTIQLKICEKIGKLREHNEGKADYVWPIKTVESNSQIKTFSEHNDEAQLHTDTQYRAIPERYMTLSCIQEAKCGGGETILLDSLKIFEEIKSDSALLSKLKQKFPIAIPDIFVIDDRKYIEETIISEYPKFRFRYDTFLKGLALKQPENFEDLKNTLDEFNSKLQNSKHIQKLKLKKGDIILIDNHRMLHGRTSFTDTDRLLYRVRVDDFNNKLKV